MILMLNVHYSRVVGSVGPDRLLTDPAAESTAYRDGFGNWCNRLVAPAGGCGCQRRHGDPRQAACPTRRRTLPSSTPVEELPEDTLVFLLGSRYCETDRLSDAAWQLFGNDADRLGPGAGDLRLRPRPHHLRLRARAADPDGLRGV